MNINYVTTGLGSLALLVSIWASSQVLLSKKVKPYLLPAALTLVLATWMVMWVDFSHTRELLLSEQIVDRALAVEITMRAIGSLLIEHAPGLYLVAVATLLCVFLLLHRLFVSTVGGEKSLPSALGAGKHRRGPAALNPLGSVLVFTCLGVGVVLFCWSCFAVLDLRSFLAIWSRWQ